MVVPERISLNEANRGRFARNTILGLGTLMDVHATFEVFRGKGLCPVRKPRYIIYLIYRSLRHFLIRSRDNGHVRPIPPETTHKVACLKIIICLTLPSVRRVNILLIP